MDPCSIHDADCEMCLANEQCQVCGIGESQKCIRQKDDEGEALECGNNRKFCNVNFFFNCVVEDAERRITCDDCSTFNCNNCTANPGCSWCRFGIGSVLSDGACENGLDCEGDSSTDLFQKKYEVSKRWCACLTIELDGRCATIQQRWKNRWIRVMASRVGIAWPAVIVNGV